MTSRKAKAPAPASRPVFTQPPMRMVLPTCMRGGRAGHSRRWWQQRVRCRRRMACLSICWASDVLPAWGEWRCHELLTKKRLPGAPGRGPGSRSPAPRPPGCGHRTGCMAPPAPAQPPSCAGTPAVARAQGMFGIHGHAAHRGPPSLAPGGSGGSSTGWASTKAHSHLQRLQLLPELLHLLGRHSGSAVGGHAGGLSAGCTQTSLNAGCARPEGPAAAAKADGAACKSAGGGAQWAQGKPTQHVKTRVLLGASSCVSRSSNTVDGRCKMLAMTGLGCPQHATAGTQFAFEQRSGAVLHLLDL